PREVITSITFHDQDTSLARHYAAWACVGDIMNMTSSKLVGEPDFYIHSDLINKYLDENIIPIRKSSMASGFDGRTTRLIKLIFRLVPVNLETTLLFEETDIDFEKVNPELARFRDDLQRQIHEILEDFETIGSSS